MMYTARSVENGMAILHNGTRHTALITLTRNDTTYIVVQEEETSAPITIVYGDMDPVMVIADDDPFATEECECDTTLYPCECGMAGWF